MGYGAAGVDTFAGLLDTPATYAGQALKLFRVNVGENALEFVVGSKFTKTKVFDGSVASPSTWYYQPWTIIPHWNFGMPLTGGISNYGSIIIDGNLYVMGGQRFGGGAITNITRKFNLATEKWENLANCPQQVYTDKGRAQNTSYNNGKIYFVVTHYQGGAYTKLLSYDIATDAWAVEGGDIPVGGGELFICACTDYLYLAQNGGGRRFDRFDYTLKTWGARTAHTESITAMGKIGDEIYTVWWNGSTRKHNKAGDSWVDQAQNCPLTQFKLGHSYDEDELAMWVNGLNQWNHTVYRYTPAGGWVLMFTNTRNCYPPDGFLIPSGHTTDLAYALWGENGVEVGSEPLQRGSVAKYESTAFWKLYSGAFAQGDLMIINEVGGVPVAVESGGLLNFIATGLNTIYVIDAGTYIFTLSKDFDYKGIDIYRSQWG